MRTSVDQAYIRHRSIPYREGMLKPNAEASSQPDVLPLLNLNVTKTSWKF